MNENRYSNDISILIWGPTSDLKLCTEYGILLMLSPCYFSDNYLERLIIITIE